MPRLFRERKINGSFCLPIEEAKLFSDVKEPKFNEEKMKVVIARAEKLLEEPIPLCPASLYIQFAENGNRSNYEGVYFKRRDMAFWLAIAESYEKQGRFTLKLMDVLWAIMEESSWTIPAHLASNSPTHGEFKLPAVYNDERLHAIDLFSAATGALLSIIYWLDKDALDQITPVICEKIKTLVINRQIKPFLNCTFWWTGAAGNGVNNWNPWILSNILTMNAILVDDLYTRRRVTDKTLSYIDNFTNGYAPDGGCDEGPSYWSAAGAAYFDFLEIAYDISGGKINIYDDALVKAMFEYEPKMNINRNRFINFADCPPSCSPDGSMIRRMGEKVGSELLCNFGDTMADLGDVRVSTSNPYRTLKSLMMPPHATKESFGATRVWFPYLKVMNARENAKTDEGIFVAMKGGHNGESHNHNDVGNIVVYYNGNPVLIDTGCGRYTKQTFSAQRYELWFMQSHYHNLPDIGGIGEHQGAQYHSADEIYDEKTGGVKMELKNAYLPEAGIISYTRETVLIGKVVHIRDNFDLDAEKEVDIHFICAVKPEIKEDGSIALAEGRTMRYSDTLKAEIEEYAANDPGIEGAWKTPVLWRIHLKANVKKASFEVTVE